MNGQRETGVSVWMVFAIVLSSMLECFAQSGDVESYATAQGSMVAQHLLARDIRDSTVLAAMASVPRHLYVPKDLRRYAYYDSPLPIGNGQTISQPYIVALMTQSLRLDSGDRVLEVGTGSGYQAAILAEIAAEVYTIEIIPELADRSRQLLQELGYNNINVRLGDGYLGWPEKAPFDAVIVTAAPDHVPRALVEQLTDGGRLVLPVGDQYQELIRITRTGDVEQTERLLPVRFVPMTGRAESFNDFRVFE